MIKKSKKPEKHKVKKMTSKPASKQKATPKVAADYRYLTADTEGPVVRTSDGVIVANTISDQGAQDWTDYQTWLAVPNTPDPYVPPYVPLRFHFTGEPANSAIALISVLQPLTIAAGLAGCSGYCDTPPAADATFLVDVNSAGALTNLGAMDCAAGDNNFTQSGPGGSVLAGDVIVITAPANSDSAMADITFTIQGLPA